MLNEIIQKFISLGPLILIKWSILLFAFIVMLILIHTENQRTRNVVSQLSNGNALFSMARKRGWYAILLFAIYILTVVTYDLVIFRQQSQRLVLSAGSSAPVVSANTQESSKSHSNISTTDLPASPIPPTLSLFESVTTFSEKNADVESFMDILKKRYEQLLVTYFILEKCKLEKIDSFHLIQEIILRDIEKVRAAEDNLTKIIDAARGTYDEMYSTMACDGAEISTMKSSFEANMQQIGQFKP